MEDMEQDKAPRECAWCERGWAAIGLLMGTVIILMSIDLVTNGFLASLISRPNSAQESEAE
jgi:hypothetical protein